MKRILGALTIIPLLSGLAFALPESIQFDVVIRDFQPSHPDFEDFDNQAAQIAANPLVGFVPSGTQCYGEAIAPPDFNAALGYSPMYSACTDGYPCGSIMPNGQPAVQAKYGEFKLTAGPSAGQTIRDFHKNAIILNGGTKQPDMNWEQPVYITKNMVMPELMRVVESDPYSWVPVRNNATVMSCHDQNFAQWFSDVPGVNKTIQTLMTLKLKPVTAANPIPTQFYIDSKEMPNQSYFPLDSFDTDPPVATWGKQSLAMWCPPTSDGASKAGSFGLPAGPVQTMCGDLLAAGGPKSPAAVDFAVSKNPNLASLKHNYAFTMMGYTKFTYNSSDTFVFSGDDDMWIFVDGHLTADLGGTHLPAEARIAMIDLANQFGWIERSKHDLHFFYADRQTDGSNLKITTTMADISIPNFGAPRIKTASLNAAGVMLLSLTQNLSQQSIAQINAAVAGSNYYPVLVIKKISGPNGTVVQDTFGVAVKSFQKSKAEDPNSAGTYLYELDGALCNLAGCSEYTLSEGDSLAFNYYAADRHIFEPASNMPKITSEKNKAVEAWYWGFATASAGSTVPMVFKTGDPSPQKPTFPGLDEMLGSGGSTAGGVHFSPIGSAGQPVARGKTGEINLALYRSESDSGTGLGIPPAATSGYGAFDIDTSKQYVLGPEQGVLSISHCSSTNATNNSCLALSFNTDRPFLVNVIVYDHLGGFVTQFQSGVSTEQFTALQNKNAVEGVAWGSCTVGMLPISTGKVKATIEVYPFSQTGRKLGTGVYILKVDVISNKHSYCLLGEKDVAGVKVPSTTGQLKSMSFSRTFQQMKVPFMRIEKK